MNTFTAQFSRLRRSQWLGRLLAALLAALAATAAVWLVLGVLDALLGLSTGARVALTVIAAVLAGGFTLFLLVRAARFSAKDSAESLDALTHSPRRPVSAALALHPDTATTPLARWLMNRSLDEAAAALTPVPSRAAWPKRALRFASGGVLATVIVTGALWFSNKEAFRVVAHRLLHPATDLPPWSRLKFTIEPAAPSANYGGEALLTVTCSEAPAEAVECLVRVPRTGEVLRLPASREADRRFSRRLESLTEPVEIAFAAGRARSGWTPLEILYQPRVLSGTLLVEAPPWLEVPSLTLPLDTPEVTVTEGARLTLTLSSNRPLSGGTLTVTPAAGVTTTPAPLEAGLTTKGDAAFTWTASVSGTLSVTLRDVRRTPSAQPLTLPLTVKPDQPPAVDLSSPPPLLLATPYTQVPLAGNAEDDHGLSRVRLVRTLSGFRDRPQTVAPALRDKRYDFSDKLALGPLGLVPGQTIELFLEASDHNPSLLGQSSSAVSRVRIISENEYAERLQAQTTLQEFAARFNAAQQALQEAREALEKLDAALASGDPQATSEAKAAAGAAHKNAAELMEKLAEDFPAFEMEKRLKELAKQAAAPVRENLSGLESLPGDKDAARAAVAEMMKRLVKPESDMTNMQQDAAKVAEMGKLLEMAAKFREIYQTQESLVRRISTIREEMRKGMDQNRRLLPSLADTQEKNRKALDEFAVELKKRAEAMPDDEMFQPMKDSALQFVEALTQADPGSAMDSATSAGRASDLGGMLQSAELARAILERLMQKQEPFPQACQGQCPSFSVPHPDMNETMAQLLAGMCRSSGMGTQPGEGMGMGAGGSSAMGGFGPTGSPMAGYAMMDLPVVGPDRMRFDAASMGGQGGGKDGQTPGRKGLPVKTENSAMKPGDQRTGDTPPPPVENVPEAYREAVKRYFTPAETNKTN